MRCPARVATTPSSRWQRHCWVSAAKFGPLQVCTWLSSEYWPFSLPIATSSTAIRSNVSRIIARLVMYHVFFETFDFECCPVLSYRLTDHRLHLRRPWYRSLDWNTTLIPRGNLACFSQSAFQQMQQSIVMLIAALTATDKITAEAGAAALILLGTIQVALAMPEQIMGVIKSMVLKAGDKVTGTYST